MTDARASEDAIAHGTLPDTDEMRTFLDGSTRSHTRLTSAVIGLGTYAPGWRWSLHAGPQTQKTATRHIGYIISGQLAVQTASGDKIMLGPGDAFEVGPGHDAWVIGDIPCVAVDFRVLH